MDKVNKSDAKLKSIETDITAPNDKFFISNLDIEKSDNSITLEILSPLDKKDDASIKKYLKHLKDAIDNRDVKNLALSGVYGSGKSTIIKSFKSLYPTIKTLEISLSSFNETKAGEYNMFKDQIQLNILQQIIYSQKADKLPESRINRISEVDVWEYKNWAKVIPFFLLFISTYLLLTYYSYQLNPNNWNLSDSFSISCFVLVILCLLSIFLVGQVLIEIFNNIRINKISLKDAELGSKKDNKDILNKHIDEILYFFEKIPIDIVVIEDLDRFNTTEIYRTLREVNFIINTYLANINSSQLKKVTFLYAIKDDLFSNELDRTKFFDLIIPSIPFVNYSNSKNVLSNKLNVIFKDNKAIEKPSKEFINVISTFITDNRTLLNIINEFIIYKEQQKLETEELNSEKLLALIIYKNLRPKDFARLHNCQSNIDIIFENKHKIIKKSEDDQNVYIDKLIEKNVKIKEENLDSVRQLNTIYIYHIKEVINSFEAKGLVIGDQEKTFEKLIEEACDMSCYYNQEIKYYQKSYGNSNVKQNTTIKLSQIDKKTGYKYSDKFDLIVNKNTLILEKENEIKNARTELTEIKSRTLKEIFKNKDRSKEKLKVEFDSFYSESLILENERAYNDSLLIFLLVNGYIDEHYREYISTFQKGGLNEMDHEFKINIISEIHEPKPYDYKLTNVQDILEELPINYFQDSRILNIQLLDFLIVKKDVYQEKSQTLFGLISKWNSKRTKEFFRDYIYKGNQKDKLINELSKSWKELWEVISSDINFIEDDKKLLVSLILNFADEDTIMRLNSNFSIEKYINENPDILYNYEGSEYLDRIEKLSSNKILQFKIDSIFSIKVLFPKIFKMIYENNFYKINLINIGELMRQEIVDYNEFKFSVNNLSYIYKCGMSNLISYIEEDDYKNYIENFYTELNDESQDEPIESILRILNNEEVSIENKTIFIKKQINRIDDITTLKTTYLSDLVFQENKIKANWNNVFQYYNEKDNLFNNELINFLNKESNYSVLSLESKIKLNVDKELQEEFILKFLSNNYINIEAYELLIKSCFPIDFEIPIDFDFETISDLMLEKLININKIIPLTKDNFESIKSSHPNLHIKLLLRKWADYLEFCEDNEIEINDKILILKEDSLKEDFKYLIIKDNISENDLQDKSLAIEVVNLILNFTLDKDKKNVITNLKLKSLLNHPLVTENKIKLINLLSDKLNKMDILEIQEKLPAEYRVYPKCQIILANNNYNWEYVKILQNIKVAGEAKITKKDEIRVWLNNFSN